jgi:hypothetical protein
VEDAFFKDTVKSSVFLVIKKAIRRSYAEIISTAFSIVASNSVRLVAWVTRVVAWLALSSLADAVRFLVMLFLLMFALARVGAFARLAFTSLLAASFMAIRFRSAFNLHYGLIFLLR